MKRIVSALLLIVLFAGSAFGLSDREYRHLKRESRLFAGADETLTEVWHRIEDQVTRFERSAFEELRDEQLEWIRSGRDRTARRYMRNGASKDVAYANATYDRVRELKEWETQMFSDVEPRYYNDNTALILAAAEGDTQTVRKLLRSGSDVDARNKYGMTARMYAAERNHAGALDVLLKAGADIDAKNNEGSTALMIAVIHGCEDAAEILLDAGAHVRTRNDDGKRAVDYAWENRSLRGTHVLRRLERLSR